MQLRRAGVLVSLILLGLAVGLSGCFSLGSARHPTPSPGFQAKKEYGVPYDRAWLAVNRTLQSQRINVASSDKDGGRLVTDYIQGETQTAIIAFLTTRYRYNVLLERSSQERTRINIIATLESSSEGLPWHDITKDNPRIVQGLEQWLYERIEGSL